MKRYLITGGAGFIGSAITKSLLSNGNFVRILDDESRGSKQRIPKSKNLEFYHADIRDSKSVEKACKGVESIIHLAYINGTKYFYERPDLVLEVGVKGMINVLDGAKNHNVSELFLASSSEVYQTPPSIPTPENVPYFIPDPYNPRYSYAGGKIISELLSLYLGQKIFKKVVIFRPHNVYGPNMGIEHVIPELIYKIYTLKKKNQNKILLPIQGSGKETRSFIYIDDFASAINILLEKASNKQIYNIGTGEEVSIRHIIKLLSKITQTAIAIQNNPPPSGSALRRCPDITKISNLGFKQKTTLEDGIRKTLMWYNSYLSEG